MDAKKVFDVEIDLTTDSVSLNFGMPNIYLHKSRVKVGGAELTIEANYDNDKSKIYFKRPYSCESNQKDYMRIINSIGWIAGKNFRYDVSEDEATIYDIIIKDYDLPKIAALMKQILSVECSTPRYELSFKKVQENILLNPSMLNAKSDKISITDQEEIRYKIRNSTLVRLP